MVSSRILKTGLVALALSGAALVSFVPAQAGESTGTWRNGMVDGPYGPGYYGPDGSYYGNGHRSPRRRVYVEDYYQPAPPPRYYRRYEYDRPRYRPSYGYGYYGDYDPYSNDR